MKSKMRAMRAVAFAMLGGLSLGVFCAVIFHDTRTALLAFILLLVGVIGIWQTLSDISGMRASTDEDYDDPLYHEPDYVEDYLRVRRDPPRKADS